MKSLLLAAAAAALISGPVLADKVNFGSLPDGSLGTSTVTVNGVTFTAPEELYHLTSDFADRGGAICSLDVSEFTCENDMTVNFNGTVKRLRLGTAGFNPGDSVTITVYRGATAKGSVTITADQAINLRRFGRVTRIVLDDNSSGAGYSYGNFRFRRVDAAAREEASPAAPKSHKQRRAKRD